MKNSITQDLNHQPEKFECKTVNFQNHFYSWNFGTINIRSGKEKSEGSKMYMITKQVAQTKLSFCCQEVRHRNTSNKITSLDTGKNTTSYGVAKNKGEMQGLEF